MPGSPRVGEWVEMIYDANVILSANAPTSATPHVIISIFSAMSLTRLALLHRSPLSRVPALLKRSMSAQAAIARLESPLRDLVTGAAQDGAQDFGKTEKDKAEVVEWIEKVAQGDIVKPEASKVCVLAPRLWPETQ